MPDFSRFGPFRSLMIEHHLSLAAGKARLGWALVALAAASFAILAYLLSEYGLPLQDDAAALSIVSPLFLISGCLFVRSSSEVRRLARLETVRSIMEK